jgi:glutathione peroxidase
LFTTLFLEGESFAMRAFVAGLIGLGILLAVLGGATADEKGGKKVPPVLNFKMKTLQGKEIKLADYQGKVVLIVNVASQCGYTPQYKGLQALHDKYVKDGLVILGVPCNDFGRQEPGTSKEIAEFCDKNYGVKFELLEKVTVKGKDTAPLYKYLTSKKTNPQFGGDIKWNFTKFLVSRAGRVVNRFEPATEPDSTDLVKAIEEELAAK